MFFLTCRWGRALCILLLLLSSVFCGSLMEWPCSDKSEFQKRWTSPARARVAARATAHAQLSTFIASTVPKAYRKNLQRIEFSHVEDVSPKCPSHTIVSITKITGIFQSIDKFKLRGRRPGERTITHVADAEIGRSCYIFREAIPAPSGTWARQCRDLRKSHVLYQKCASTSFSFYSQPVSLA